MALDGVLVAATALARYATNDHTRVEGLSVQAFGGALH
jgi:hypothetical protein